MGIMQTVTKTIAGVWQTLTGNAAASSASLGAMRKERGMQVYTMSQLMGMTGRTKSGDLVTGTVEQPIFYLNIEEREGIFRLCAPVHAVVSGRMNRISGLPWTITCDRKNEDLLATKMKSLHQIFKEYEAVPDFKYQVARAQIVNFLRRDMPDLLPDLSNFQGAMMRWKKRIDNDHTDRAEQVQEWLLTPNLTDTWEDFVKKYVYDLLIHGNSAIYKETLSGRVENFYLLAGGTVMPLKSAFVGGLGAFAQVTQGYEPKIYYQDEISFSQYIPATARAYGYVPLEALINKIAETMLFDKLMAEQADGTKLPEKMVIVTESSPFGSMDKEFSVSMDADKQKRIETKLNQPKRGAVVTFSGNSATVVDLSRENTMEIQMQRQKDIREEVGMVFQASSMEMNLTGSEDVSGRNTAEEQSKIMMNKAILPITNQLTTKINRELLPFRFGLGYKFAFDSGADEMAQIELLAKKMTTGLFSVNEIRSDELNLDAFPGEQFELPTAAQQPQPGTEDNPMFTKGIL